MQQHAGICKQRTNAGIKQLWPTNVFRNGEEIVGYKDLKVSALCVCICSRNKGSQF